VGDASVIALADLPIDLEDVQGNILPFDRRLVARGMVIGGTWYEAGL
jgi:hypothetical protein